MGDGTPEVLPLVVLITWRDAHWELNEPDEWPEDYLVRTVGYLIEDGERFVCVAGEVLPDGNGFRQWTRIPVEMVVEREVLKPLPTMSLLTGQGG